MSASPSNTSNGNADDASHPSQTIEINPDALFAQIDPTKMQDGGYNIFCKPFISQKSVQLLRSRMEKVFSGEYSTGKNPTKTPSQLSSKAAAKKNNKNNSLNSSSSSSVSVIHMINISKADKHYQQLALHPAIGEAVARVMNWPSVKFAQDQVWCKPPGAGALSFHRDSPYFDMVPQDVATLWITFDDLESYSSLGPLEYCAGSHLWGKKNADGDRAAGARTGSANQFFDPDYYALLRSAAQLEGISQSSMMTSKTQEDDDETAAVADKQKQESKKTETALNDSSSSTSNSTSNSGPKFYHPPSGLQIEVVKASAGGGSIHNGRTFHGSGPNRSTEQSRRGIGIHYVRGDAKFQKKRIVEKIKDEATGEEKEIEREVLKLGKLWEPLKAPDGSDDLSEEFFPTVFPVTKRRDREDEERQVREGKNDDDE